jgi:hypothetical protein
MSKEIWGPLVWGIMHKIADVSDRSDVLLLWNTVLKNTAKVLPCEQCQRHMSDYLMNTSFVPKNWSLMTGPQIRSHTRHFLHRFHNSVNGRLKKPMHELPDIPNTPRTQQIREISQLFESITDKWRSRVTNTAAIKEWRKSVSLMIALVSSGSTI